MILCFIADGRSIHTQRWVDFFARKGHTIHLITYDPIGFPIEGVNEHVLKDAGNNLYLSFFPRQITINRLVKKIKPDLIHAHFIAKYGFHLVLLHARPQVISAWGDDVLILPRKSRLIRYYTKKVLECVDLIYSVSFDISRHIISDFNISQNKIHYLPFGVDTDMFTPQPVGERGRRNTIEVFSNRGFYPVYDMETLVQGFARAYSKEPHLRLTLKCEGPEEQKIRNLVRSLGIEPIVIFKKKSSYSDVPFDYRNADIFLTTSISDGTPVSISEAMASGIPCIATTVGGIPEWVEDKKTGLLIPPGSPEAVTEALLTLAQNPSFRSELGETARRKIVEKGEWKTLMLQAEKDYQTLIERYRKEKL